jgi:hypothetical protein
MSWLDANEVFLMEVVSRDRIDDLRSSVDRATASAESAGERPHDGDGALLETLRRRDPTAAEHLVARYGGRAYRLAVRITRNAADAEEVVQDAFWSVIRKIDTFRGDAAFGSWLYRIVANTACQKLRRVARHRNEISLEEVLPSFHGGRSTCADRRLVGASRRSRPPERPAFRAGRGDRRPVTRVPGRRRLA